MLEFTLLTLELSSSPMESQHVMPLRLQGSVSSRLYLCLAHCHLTPGQRWTSNAELMNLDTAITAMSALMIVMLVPSGLGAVSAVCGRWLVQSRRALQLVRCVHWLASVMGRTMDRLLRASSSCDGCLLSVPRAGWCSLLFGRLPYSRRVCDAIRNLATGR